MKILVMLICVIPTIMAEEKQKPTPIIMWHGIGDTCCLPITTGMIKIFIQTSIPDIYVYSMQIGNTSYEELKNGYFMNPNEQVKIACRRLKGDVNLKDGFNMVGLSQGSLFLGKADFSFHSRAVIQRCGHELPPVKNFISLGGQHQGVYGLPRCISLSHETCEHMRELLNYAAYHSSVQKSFVQATYWHDPYQESEYKNRSMFLADINNEMKINETYRSNLKKLERFVLVKFEYDSVVQPRESQWFGFHAPGQGKLQDLQQSAMYLEDRLGLQEMDKAGKLVFLSHPSDHLELEKKWFRTAIIPYLSS